MKVAFRVDASGQIGTGHLARCLTLANHLRRFGADTRFLCRAPSPYLADQITSLGHALIALAPPMTALEASQLDLAHGLWLGVSQEQDIAESLDALDAKVDLLVVDHYGIDYRWQNQMREAAGLLMVIDDLADRRHECDLLLDQNIYNIGATGRYAKLAPARCEMLLGPDYALLRPEFCIPPKRESRAGQRINIFLGGTDPDGGTLWALEAVAPLCNETLRVDVIVGGSNPHQPAIRAACADLPAATLHVQSNEIARLFTIADLAIGAGGSACLERCNRGLPQILTSFAQNQRLTCDAFARAGVALNVGDMDRLSPAGLRATVVSLLANQKQLREMGDRGRSVVDGKGTQRVAEKVAEALAVKA
jgi:UDP-2,4-diacetamido-2,4,6-trideoxy-beta-L-altropyranose hydrolase